MIKNRLGYTRTPRQFAKEAVLLKGESAFYWQDNTDEYVVQAMTAKEVELITQEIELQFNRVEAFLGVRYDK